MQESVIGLNLRMLGAFAGDVARPIGQRLNFLGYPHVQRQNAFRRPPAPRDHLGWVAMPRYSSARSRAASSLTTRQRRIIKPTLLPPKSTKANSRSASRAGIATKSTLSSLHHSRVWFAGEAPLTPTICGSLSPARWDARSATSSRYPCAERITGTTSALATRRPGGLVRRSIPWRSRGSSGFRRGESNEGDSNLLPSLRTGFQRLSHANRHEDGRGSPNKKRKYIKMAKKTERPARHPDFMIVAVSLGARPDRRSGIC
jgi:hypothetical protein